MSIRCTLNCVHWMTVHTSSTSKVSSSSHPVREENHKRTAIVRGTVQWTQFSVLILLTNCQANVLILLTSCHAELCSPSWSCSQAVTLNCVHRPDPAHKLSRWIVFTVLILLTSCHAELCSPSWSCSQAVTLNCVHRSDPAHKLSRWIVFTVQYHVLLLFVCGFLPWLEWSRTTPSTCCSCGQSSSEHNSACNEWTSIFKTTTNSEKSTTAEQNRST